MAQKIVSYTARAERAVIISTEEAQGWRVLHDDYVDSWRPGDELEGQLTFDDTPDPPVVPTPDEVRTEALRLKLWDNTLTFDELKEYLRLKGL